MANVGCDAVLNLVVMACRGSVFAGRVCVVLLESEAGVIVVVVA